MSSKFDQVYTHCPVCNTDDIRSYHQDSNGIKISKCPSCSVQFMNPVYSDNYINDFYNNYTEDSYSQKVLDEQNFTANDYLQSVEKYLGRTGSMLDFGSGNGQHSQVAMRRGWEVVGYDIDCKVAEKISNKFNFTYLCGAFEDVEWKRKKFDLVYANQVVEHLKDPISMIKLIHARLNENGIFLVAVPNINSLSSRIKIMLEKAGVRKKNKGKYYDTGHHVFYYDKKSIVKMLKIAGFDVISLHNCKKPRLHQNKLAKFFRRNIVEKIISNSVLYVLAKKTSI
ncbi:MAG: class I SAM-dependent methyltransferase [Woeseiaceae bacterium]